MHGYMNITISNNRQKNNILHLFPDFNALRLKMDIIWGNFENFKFLKEQYHNIDQIFINCEELFKKEIEENSTYSHKLSLIIKKSLTICKNLIILFPKKFKMQEVATLFSQNLDTYTERFVFISIHIKFNISLNKSYSLEIDLFKLNGEVEKYLVYYGTSNSIKHFEEKNFLSTFLNSDNYLDYTQKNIFILNLIEKLGIYTCCQMINKIQISCHRTILQNFLDNISRENLLDSGEILEMVQEKKPLKLKKKVSMKSNRYSSKYLNHESDTEKKASCSQIGSVYTDNFYEISSEVHDRLSILKSTSRKLLQKTFV